MNMSFAKQKVLAIDGKEVESVDKMKLLGITLTTDLKWRSITDEPTKKAFSKLLMIKRLITKGKTLEDLKDIHCQQVWSVLEFGVPVCNGSITQEVVSDIDILQL